MAWLAASALGVAPSIDEPVRTGAKAPDDVAVVIGNEDYGFIPDVPFAKRDAQAFYEFLVYTRGVPMEQIRLLNDKSKEVIEQAVSDLASQNSTSGRFWIYFAGHGAADPSTGVRLLLGKDVDVDDSRAFVSRGLDVAALQSDAARSGKPVVMVIDACFNGAGRDGRPILDAKRYAVPAWAVDVEGVTEWAATGPEQLAGGLPAVQHGIFTYFALGAMRGWADGEIDGARDGSVTLAEAQSWVARSIRSAQIHGQSPVVRGKSSLLLVQSPWLEPAPTPSAMLELGRAVSPDPALPRPGSASSGAATTNLGAEVDFAALAARAARAQAAADESAAAALAAQAARVAAEQKLSDERARMLDVAASGVRTAAAKDFDLIAPAVSRLVTPETRPMLEAYVARYGSATVTVDGVLATVEIPEVERVRSALSAPSPSTLPVSEMSPQIGPHVGGGALEPVSQASHRGGQNVGRKTVGAASAIVGLAGGILLGVGGFRELQLESDLREGRLAGSSVGDSQRTINQIYAAGYVGVSVGLIGGAVLVGSANGPR